MAYLNGFYLNNPHKSQFDGSYYQGSNCTPTSAANGINAASGGKYQPTGAKIRSLVARREEVQPSTPGWAIQDVDLAMTRHFPSFRFDVRSGRGWDDVVRDHKSGLYLIAQGDSDRFSNSTCSGKFDGNHCIGVSPITKQQGGDEWWWIDDPICPIGRWERRKVIFEYMSKLASTMRYGMFLKPVPRSGTLWGSDVSSQIRAVNPSGWTVGQAIKLATGHFGTVINMSDLKAALKAANIKYGVVVNPDDVTNLINWYKKHN